MTGLCNGETSRWAFPALDIGIAMSDTRNMLRFYCGGLCLVELTTNPPLSTKDQHGLRSMYEFAIGYSRLKLWSMATARMPIAAAERMGQSGLRYLTIWTHDIHEICTRVASLGFALSDPPHASRRGSPFTIAFVQDPDGNWVELVQPNDSVEGRNHG